MKRILIVGKNSYIGKAIYAWLNKFENQYQTDIISSRDEDWKKKDFSQYDSVVDLAGIAHIMHITEDMRELFYSVNRDLTIELGQAAKDAGVKQFIYFSSMNVYGDFSENITDKNSENPSSFYGDSKLQGEKGLAKLADNNFAVANVRPPFVYGYGCKGNYNTISKIAKKTTIFTTYKNKKSMIYIDNLCEFVRLLIEDGKGGIFTPQNKELVSTSELVRQISKINNHKIWFTGMFNWAIRPMVAMSRTVRRAFAEDCYSLNISNDYDFKYCVVDFADSIKYTEIGVDSEK